MPAPKKKPNAKKAATKVDAKNLVDAALKRRWAEEFARLAKARSDETQGWDDLYEAVGEIVYSNPPLYLAGGYKTARAFFAEHFPGQTEQTIRRYVRVARYFDPPDEAKFGIAKLELLLDYLEAEGGAPLAAAKIDPARARVAVRSGKTTRKVAFPDLTFDQLRAATRGATTAAKRPKTSDAPVVVALRAVLKKAGLGAIGLRVRGGKLDMTGIPLAEIARVATVVSKAKLPG